MNLIHVNIEPTNRCQLNCKFCGDNKTREQGDMNILDYINILSKIKDFNPKPEIRLFLSGEPFLHSYICIYIDIALELGHNVLIHTNGLIDKANDLIKVAKQYPGRLTIKFSFIEEVAGKSLKNLKRLAFINNQYNRPINLFIYQIVAYGKQIVPIKIDGVAYEPRYPHNWDVDKSVEGAEPQSFKIPCGFLNDSLGIYWNGDCPICCADLNGRVIIGNIFKDGISTIIEKLDHYYALQQKGKSCPPCDVCERYNRQ